MKKFILFAAAAVLASAFSAHAATVATATSAEGEPIGDYDTLDAAMAAVTAGGTVTLVSDCYFASDYLYVGKANVTLDLDGHTISRPPGNFIRLGATDSGFTVKDGSIVYTQAGGATFWFDAQNLGYGLGKVTVENCHFGGECVVYGFDGEVDFVGCTVQTTYLVSNGGSNGLAVNLKGGTYAPAYATPAGTDTPNVVTVYAGDFNFNPSVWLAEGYIAVSEQKNAGGIATSYTVYPVAEAPAAVKVVTSGGAETNGYATLQLAIADAVGGDTVTMFADETVSDALAIDVPNLTLDLNGHQLSKNSLGDFIVLGSSAGGLVVKNGSIYASKAVFHMYECEGLGAVTVTNCTLTGECATFGRYGTINFFDSAVKNQYFTSSSNGSGLSIVMWSGVAAPTEDVNCGEASFTIRGGYFTFNPIRWVDAGYSTRSIEETHMGAACSYMVYLPEAGAKPVEVVPAGGGAPAGYDTLALAIAAAADGDTIVFNASVSVDGAVIFDKSVDVDVNGFTFSNGDRDFITVAAGKTVTLRNGTVYQSGYGSAFVVDTGATLNVSNCEVGAYCCVYGAGSGTVNLLSGTVVSATYLGSSNGVATMVVDGASVYTSYMRDGGASGTYIRLVSGLFRYYPDLGGWGEIASGSVLVAGAVQFGGLGYTYAVATQADALAVAETVYGGIYYRSVQDAFEAMVPGSTITLINDVNRQLGTSKACVLDLGGHVLSYSGDIFEVYNCEVTIRNGTIRELGSGVSCFKLSANGTLNLESDVSIEGAAGQNTNCFYIPGDGATVNILGADISTTRIFSSNWPQGVSVSVTGAGKYPGEILWPGIPSPASGTIAVAGGWWNEDPSAYLASGIEGLKVSDHGESYAARGFPCRYHVHSGAVDSGIIVIVR